MNVRFSVIRRCHDAGPDAEGIAQQILGQDRLGHTASNHPSLIQNDQMIAEHRRMVEIMDRDGRGASGRLTYVTY